jgi:glycerol-3-phosphate dehydrogenase
MYDISIIGAGVIGCAIARELSKYDLNICLIEKSEDVTNGASKANSGIVHGGFAGKFGTLKGELCIKGNKMYKALDKELNFGYRETGALVIGFNDKDENKIREQYENGIKVGCDDLEIIYGDKIKEIEPHINEAVKVALYSKKVGVVSPYEFTIALAENAVENGVQLKLETEVIDIEKFDNKFKIITTKENIESKYIINAAGLYSDKIANMVGIHDFKILPRRGQYILLGKNQGHLVKTVVFQVPTDKGKGILVTTTYHGNLMIGPNAEEVDDKDDVATTAESLQYIIETAKQSIKDFNIKGALTTFAGIRAVSSTGDFIIEESRVKGFINAAGIDSPGLTSAPAIALKVVSIIKKFGFDLEKKDNFNPYRKAIIINKDRFFDGVVDHSDPTKNIICRCEKVTEAEIVDAIHRGIPVKTTDAIKRRTRAGMGPCQGNSCQCRVKKIIARELNIPEDAVTTRSGQDELPLRANLEVIKRYRNIKI